MRWTALFLISLIFPLVCFLGEVAEPVPLEEAIALALERNRELQLFYRQWDLAQRQEGAKTLPELQVHTTPLAVTEQGMTRPTGQVVLKVPLGQWGAAQGQVTFQMDEGFSYQPSAQIQVNYPLFRSLEGEAVPEEDALTQARNDLIVKVYETMIAYIKAEQELAFQRRRLEHYEAERTGILLTNGDSNRLFTVLQQIEETTAAIGRLELQREQAREDFGQLLDRPDVYPAYLEPEPLTIILDQETMMERALQYSSSCVAAREALEAARMKLEHLQRFGGWDLNLSLGGAWSPEGTDYGLSFTASTSLSRSKALELEAAQLQREQAELQLELTTFAVEQEISGLFRQLTLLEETMERLAVRRSETGEELEKLQRQYAAGMITELTLQAVELNLEELAIQIQSTRYDYLLLQLELLRRCGFALEELVRGR